jgi:hypothetical protein
MSRLGVLAVAFALLAGCSSSHQAATPDAGRDGAPLGTSYACVGGFIVIPDAGEVPAPADAGNAATCVVGRSYCRVRSWDKSVGVPPDHTCENLADGGLGVCADTPTCACICAQGVICRTECSCDDRGGFAVVTCDQI